jgi:hypothetical protein
MMRRSLTLPLSDGRGAICCTRLGRGWVMPQGRNGEGMERHMRLWACGYCPGVFIAVKRDGRRVFQAVQAGCLGGYILTGGFKMTGNEIWQGEGWYIVRGWDPARQAFEWPRNSYEAVWAEDVSVLERTDASLQERGLVPCAEYLGDGEFPDAPCAVTPGYCDFDYGKWREISQA